MEWLSAALAAPPSRSAVRRLIMAGALRVDGRPARSPAMAIEPGARLQATIRGGGLVPPPGPSTLDPSRVLFEDAGLIAVDKPAGLPTVATADPRRTHLVGLVQRLLAGRQSPRDPLPYLGVHQRLDRDTSGVVLFTKDPAVNSALAAQFAAREVAKTYVALTARPARLPPSAWRAEASVDPDADGAARTRGRPAVTDFRLVEALARALVVEARPRTGRKHQIRIHLARAGLPILGDDAYGGAAARRAPRLMLHAARLELRHPKGDARVGIESPLPADFESLLARLREEASPPRRRTRGRRRAGRGARRAPGGGARGASERRARRGAR